MNKPKVFIQAFIDFKCELTLNEVSKLLSEKLFLGSAFIGENEGIWDEVPAVRLSQDILGLRIVLGGGDGSYTLEMESFDFDWSILSEEQKKNAVVDISENMKGLIGQLPEILIVDGHD